MKVNVLGTVYRIKYVPSLDGRGGETDFYTKEIRISEQEDVPAEYKTNNLKEMQRHVLRHELIHAFLFESGMDQCIFCPTVSKYLCFALSSRWEMLSPTQLSFK